MIALRGLAKAYQKDGQSIAVLSGVDLRIDAGQCVVVRGKSGSGKSTLLNLLAGLARPDAGEIEINGTRIDQLGAAAAGAFRAQHIGFVFQLFHLIPYLSLLDNILVPTLATANGGEDAGALRARAENLLDEFGLRSRVTHLPGEMSAGERQRAAIARAILRQPDVLLADEAAGNLDPENAAAVLACLKKYHQQGKTVVLVTHHEVPGLSGAKVRTLRLQDGKLADA